MAKITLNNIAHSYLKTPKTEADYALKKLQLDWQDGKAYALLGPSGCGKSTLLNIISGLLKPSEGSLLFDDKDVTSLTTAERNIAQVFQFPVVYDTMTVYENLAFPLKNLKSRKKNAIQLSKSEIDEKVKHIASLLGLSDRLSDKAEGLGADAKQTISLGRGLVRDDVSAILFDEPLTVIDPHLKWQLRSKLKHQHQTFQYTMIYVTHDQIEALTFADEVVVMSEGEVVQVGSPDALFHCPEHTFVGYFIGSPGMNLMSLNLDNQHAFIADNVEIELPESYQFLLKENLNNELLTLGVRPEFVSFNEIENSPSCMVEVVKTEDLGRHLVVHFKINDGIYYAIVEESVDTNLYQNGSRKIWFKSDSVHVYKNNWRIKPKKRLG